MVAAAVSRVQENHLDVVVPQTELKALFRQAEQELYRSKAFRQALKALQRETEELSEIQGSLQQACKEAIRLTLRQVFVASKDLLEQVVKGQSVAESPSLAIAPVVSLPDPGSQAEPEAGDDEEDSMLDPFPLLKQAAETTHLSTPIKPIKALATPASSRLRAKNAQQVQQVQLERKEKHNQILTQLGQELKQMRERRSLSVAELHQRTLVPMHHIHAIESGQVERLPEDIYVRGFVRQIGDALDLDGAAIARLLPSSADLVNPVPSWYHEEEQSALHPMHLYVGYTALIAGTMGSLVWMNQQPFDPMAFQQDFEWLNVFQVSDRHSADAFEVTPIPNMTGVDAIAPPDRSAPESSSFNTPAFVQSSEAVAPVSR